MHWYKTKIIHFTVLIVTGLIGCISMTYASAADLSSKDQACETLSSISASGCGAESDKDISGIIGTVLNVLSLVAGIIAVVMIIIAGLKFMTASGDANGLASAKKTLIYAIVGLVVVVFAQIIVQFVLSKTATTDSIQTDPELARAEGELARRESVLEDALESGDKSKIESAQSEYESTLADYDTVREDTVNNSTVRQGSASATTQTNQQQDNIKIVTFNTRFDVSAPTTVSDVRRFTATADIVGLQEMANDRRANAVKNALVDCSKCDFDVYGPRNGAANAEYLTLWRKDKFKKLDSGNMNAASGNWGWVKEMRVTWVRLQSKTTGRSLYVLNAHAPASVESAGRYRSGEAERIRAYGLYMDTITKFINARSNKSTPVFVVGDFNVDFRYDKNIKESNFPFARMSRADTKSSFQVLGEPNRGTHFGADQDGCTEKCSGKNARVIDYVFVSNTKGLTFTDQYVSSSTCSDHNPVSVKVTWKK